MLPPRRARAPRFAPAGQSTQMIVGADATDDRTILATSATLYGAYRLKRVYYSAFSPIPDAARALPLKAPPLVREHRLYQADWLMRFYGFGHDEIVDAATAACCRSRSIPKLAWALAHRERFPVDLNRAPSEMLLRVPGLGVKAVRPPAAGAPGAPPARRRPASACTCRCEGAALRRRRRPPAGARPRRADLRRGARARRRGKASLFD